jgi:hypothetical protein
MGTQAFWTAGGETSVKSVAKFVALQNLSPIVMRITLKSKLGAAFHGILIL